MKCRSKTDKSLTAVNETKHTVTTADGKTIHKKLVSNPLKFQLSKKTEETRKKRKVASDAAVSTTKNCAKPTNVYWLKTKNTMNKQIKQARAKPSHLCQQEKRKKYPTFP